MPATSKAHQRQRQAPPTRTCARRAYAFNVIPLCDGSPMAVTSRAPVSLAAAAGGSQLLFRQLFDAATGTFTYLLADVTSRQGVLIDRCSSNTAATCR